jgi:hypothetical protein
MKKLLLLVVTITLLLTLTACDTPIVDIPIEIEEPVVPVVPETNNNTNGNNSINVTPEVIIEFVDRIVEVPAQIERLRRYQPGTYMLFESRPNNQNGYVFVVLTIDDYGRIAGVYIDQTITTRNLFRSPAGEFYVLVPGNRVNIPDAYRRIELTTPVGEYPNTSDALRSIDLVVGIDNVLIRDLVRIPVNETKQLVGNRLNQTSGLSYQEQMRLVADKIVLDNTTYGFNLVEQGELITTTSIPGVDLALDVPLLLVQSILDGPARLTNSAALRSLDNPRYGAYHPGIYVDYSSTSYRDNALMHGLSIVVVDEFGRITGVHLDEIVPSTARASIVASKQILREALAGNNQSLAWYEQANRLATQMIRNQGINGLNVVQQVTFAPARLSVDSPTLVINNMNEVGIRVNEILLATEKNLSNALFTDYVDGTYVVTATSDRSIFAYVTIKDQRIVDVFVDRLIEQEQATIFRRDRVVSIQRMDRRFNTSTGVFTGEVLVYQVDGIFYSVNDVSRVNEVNLSLSDSLTKDQQVTLTVEEQASLRFIPGWQTSTSLRLVDSLQNQWVNDTRSVVRLIRQVGNITDFMMVDGRIVNLPGATQVNAQPLLELVSKGLFQARSRDNLIFDTPFIGQPVALADGSYVAYAAPESNGAVSFNYMVVQSGTIITWVVDQTTRVNNRLTTLLFTTGERRLELVTLSNRLQQSQVDVLTDLITKPAPNPTLLSVARNALMVQPGVPRNINSYAIAIDDVIRQAVTAKTVQDLQWIRNHFLTSQDYFADRTLLAFQNLISWLPASISDSELNHEYRLVWRTTSRDVVIAPEAGRFSARMSRLDEDSVVTIELEIYLPNTNIPISRQSFDLPLQRRSTFGRGVLASSSFDLPSTSLLANTSFTLPTSTLVNIVWQSNTPTVLTNSGQTLNVSQPTVVELTAFVDLDANGVLGSNEPSRTYTVTVLPIAQAISRLETELDTRLIGDFIGNELVLGTTSSIWGLNYTWSSSSQQVTLHPTDSGTKVFVAALDFQLDIPLTAVVSAGNNITKTFRVDVGNQERYLEFARLDLPNLNTHYAMMVGDSLFENYVTTGQYYRSQITFYTTDFGRFVDAQGTIIYQHPTLDACFDIVVSSRYSGGATQSIATTSETFCVLSEASLLKRLQEDRDQLRSYIIDLSTTSHANTPLSLPITGFVHGYPIRWEVVEGQDLLLPSFDLTNLASGQVIVRTAEGLLESADRLRLRGVVDVAVGNPTIDVVKEIVVEMRE